MKIQLRLKSMPYLWQHDKNLIHHLWPKRLKNYTLWGRTYLCSPYKEHSLPRGEKPARQKKATQSIKTKTKRHKYWLSDHTYTISRLCYSATWNIPTLMNIMLVLLSKSRIGFVIFQRVKSSQLEEVKKSLTKLETSNDNLKKMVRKLTKNKKNMNEKNIIITI